MLGKPMPKAARRRAAPMGRRYLKIVPERRAGGAWDSARRPATAESI